MIIPVVPPEYLAMCRDLFRRHRPELLVPRRGRWEGPLWHDRCPGAVFQRGPLSVIASPWDTTGEDADLWLHVSVSHRVRTPTYEELTDARDTLFRPTDTVLHVWPPRSEHFNLHPNCLHLWTPMDGSRPIPDLRGDGGGV